MELFLLKNRKTAIVLLVQLTMFIFMPCSAVFALDLPKEGLRLLAESTTETCGICIEKLYKEAFVELSTKLTPGKVINTDTACRFVKPAGRATYDLTLSCYPDKEFTSSLPEGAFVPRLVFRFYTGKNHLVGIDPKDFTTEELIQVYESAKPDTFFTGELKIIAFPYGDAPAYNYFKNTNILEIHVKINALQPVHPE